jgi:exodeoxyribonuclease-3
LKLTTWNVNSLNVRLPHVLEWLDANRPDALCLQETKLPDERFPLAALREAGYAAVYAGQKTYNGVAILTRLETVGEANQVVIGNPHFPDEQRRLIAATVADVRIVNGYFPNGQAPDSDKFVYKLAWLDALAHWLAEERARYPALALMGDFNITRDDADVHDPVAWRDQIHCTEAERSRLAALLQSGLVDIFRHFDPPPGSYSWWDYRQGAFRRNAGLRIDLILLTQTLAEQATACTIDRAARKREQPSDHAPVTVEIARAHGSARHDLSPRDPAP